MCVAKVICRNHLLNSTILVRFIVSSCPLRLSLNRMWHTLNQVDLVACSIASESVWPLCTTQSANRFFFSLFLFWKDKNYSNAMTMTIRNLKPRHRVRVRNQQKPTGMKMYFFLFCLSFAYCHELPQRQSEHSNHDMKYVCLNNVFPFAAFHWRQNTQRATRPKHNKFFLWFHIKII